MRTIINISSTQKGNSNFKLAILILVFLIFYVNESQGQIIRKKYSDTIFIAYNDTLNNKKVFWGKEYNENTEAKQDIIFDEFCNNYKDNRKFCYSFYIRTKAVPDTTIIDSNLISQNLNRSITPYDINDSLIQYGSSFFKNHYFKLIVKSNDRINIYWVKHGEYIYRKSDND